jgi:DegV family protein with EDD domain
MTIRIVTDSTCDLPQASLDRYGIVVVPLYINFGAQGYQDGVEISREEFYQRLPQSDPLPTTATPGPDAFHQVYEALAAEGATEILSIHISINLSATVDSARVAAGETTSVPVTVFDSRQLSLGTGFLVERAAQAAQQGRSLNEIIALLEDQIARTHVFAALDTLEYLRRSGRMNGIVAGLGNLLQLKPILTMYEGQPGAERIRTRSRALGRVVHLLKEVGPLEKVALVHAHAPEQSELLRELAQPLLPAGELPSVEITPVIGTHIGPGAVGFACVGVHRSEKKESDEVPKR